MHNPQHSLKQWGKQNWRTKSGKKSSVTGERYLPEAAIKALTPGEYAATTRAKRKAKRQGKQFSKQPESLDKDIFNNSVEAALQSDLFIVIGTSAVVYPAASLVELAKQAGAKLVEINPEKSEANSMVELYFSEAAECCLPRLLKLI